MFDIFCTRATGAINRSAARATHRPITPARSEDGGHDARAASAERVFFDGCYLGQWCEAAHIHTELIHTEPHQTQLDLKAKMP